jgi:hypothetical protein
MTQREDVARAITFFERSDDIILLHQTLEEIAPKVKKLVRQLMDKGNEDALPPPADLRGARDGASKADALKTVRQLNDFPLLQVVARTIGRRIEAVEIAASADFPEGVRVLVPERATFPPPARRVSGVVETTGTHLRVLLDNGETWQGPPSLARLEATG